MPYFGYYGIDMYYIVLVIPCIILAFWAQTSICTLEISEAVKKPFR